MSTGETDDKNAGKFLRKKISEVEAGVHGDARNLRYEDLRDGYLNYSQSEVPRSSEFLPFRNEPRKL